MTHTLHRYEKAKRNTKDYIILSMAARDYNDLGAAPKLAENLKLMVSVKPVNYGDDNIGGIFTGLSLPEIIDNAGDGAYMSAVFDNLDDLETALLKLKESDQGMSIVVTGNFNEIFSVLKKIGLTPHTVNISAGCFGKTELLPEKEILEITSMCGHGMVCKKHVEKVFNMVKENKTTPAEGAKELAKPCTCAIFNPSRAAEILKDGNI